MKERYLPLNVALLFPGHPLLEEDFYLKVGERFVLLRKKDIPLTLERIGRWKEVGVKSVYLRAEVRNAYLLHLYSQMEDALRSNALDEEKAQLIYAISEFVTERIIEDLSEEVVKLAKEFVNECLKHLREQPDLLHLVIKNMSHDFLNQVHSNNVFFLATGLALFLGLEKAEIEKVSLGALFHDLGKTKLDPQILRKPGRLDPYEWTEVKRHPVWGRDLLMSQAKDLPEEVVRMALEHHESRDGTGYPLRLFGEEIHPYSMIIKICDVFEALCGIRPYREALTPFKALLFMKETMMQKLDRELFKAFVTFLGPDYYKKLLKK